MSLRKDPTGSRDECSVAAVTNNHKLRGLKTTDLYSLPALEARNLKSRWSPLLDVLRENLFHAFLQLLVGLAIHGTSQPVASSL